MDSWRMSELKSFMQKLNQFHHNLSFTYESSEKEIAFLDCKVNLFKNKLTTDLCVKPADTHQYLDYNSSHPEHTKVIGQKKSVLDMFF